MSESLRECPFCGHENNQVTGEPGMYEILCEGCDHACFAYFHTASMAAKAWNRRAWEPVPQSLEYDLITHAIKHGEIPQGYRIYRRKEPTP